MKYNERFSNDLNFDALTNSNSGLHTSHFYIAQTVNIIHA